MQIKKDRKKKNSFLLLSPVFCKEITGDLYKYGELIHHAPLRVLLRTSTVLAGMAYKGDSVLYFVATHDNVINHIEVQGLVPLTETQYLRFFKSKWKMNSYLSSISA